MADTQPPETGKLEPKEQVIVKLKEQRAAHLLQYNALLEGQTQPTRDTLTEYVGVTIPYSATLTSLPQREDGMEIFLESHPECRTPENFPEGLKRQQMEKQLFTYMTKGRFFSFGEALKRTLSGQEEYYMEAIQPFQDELGLAKLVMEKPNVPLTTVELAKKGLTLAEALNKGGDYWHQRADNAFNVEIALTPHVEIKKSPPSDIIT